MGASWRGGGYLRPPSNASLPPGLVLGALLAGQVHDAAGLLLQLIRAVQVHRERDLRGGGGAQLLDVLVHLVALAGLGLGKSGRRGCEGGGGLAQGLGI